MTLISNPSKRMALTDYFIQMLNCDIENLPTELLTMTPFISRSRALKKFAKCVALRNAYHTHQVCFSLLQKFQKYMNVLERGLGVLSSNTKRENLLKTMRNWKPDAINDNSTLELLRRYIVDHNAMELKSRIEKSCPNLLSNSMNHNITSFKTMDMLKLTNECDLLEYKCYKFIEHYDCFMNLTRTISGCRGLLQEPCDRMKLVVAEVQRVALSDLEPLIIRMPDIHIVHYVRDPRAISVSRAERRFLKFKNEPSWTIVDEAELLCERMRCDTKEKKRLQQIYPDSIITLRYEDLVLEPLITVTKMYRYFGRPVPLEINEWIDSRLHGTSDNGPYGVHRVEGRKHLTDWRSIASNNDTLSMNELCKDVLLEYNYDF